MSTLGYFITFHTYGTWLHGHERGSVDPKHNRAGTPYVAPSPALMERDSGNLSHPAFTLGVEAREIVQTTIASVCDRRAWSVKALNVRTTHVHVVVSGTALPERIMNDLKAWSTRRLREAGLVAADERVWSRHGSTRWLNTSVSLARAIEYTLYEQGPPLD